MQDELAALRGEIDEIDAQILALFKLRMEKAAAVADYKQARALPVLQTGREAEVLSRAEAGAGETLAPYARALFEELMRLSREYQNTRV